MIFKEKQKENFSTNTKKDFMPNRSERFEKVIRAEFGNEFRKTIDFIRNISKTGLFISTHRPFDKGNIIDIKFILPDVDYPIKVKGKVVWSRSAPEGISKLRGMGVKFINLTPWDEEALLKYLKQK